MLTDKDIQKLIKVFATKEDLKETTANLSTKEDFNKLRTSVDNYAKKADTYYQEFVALTAKVDRLEKWVNQIAKQIGMKLKP